MDTAERSPDQAVSLFFRFLQLACSCVAFSVMLTAYARSYWYWDYLPFRFLIVSTIISAFWTLLLFILELLQLMTGRKIRFLAHRLFVVIMDWLLALLLLSAASAAAAITTAYDRGAPFAGSPCRGTHLYSRFCVRTKVATAFAFLAFFFFIPHLILSTVAAAIRYFEG